MWEVIPFQVNAISPQEPAWGDIAKHFEEPKDIVQEEIQNTHGILVRMAPNLFMSPWDVVKFLEDTRWRVEEIERLQA